MIKKLDGDLFWLFFLLLFCWSLLGGYSFELRNLFGLYKFDVLSVAVLSDALTILVLLIIHFRPIPFSQYQNEILRLFGWWRSGLLLGIVGVVHVIQYYYYFFFHYVFFSSVEFRMLSQLQILVTGYLYYEFLNQSLSIRKWAALVILTAACCITQLSNSFNLSNQLSFWVSMTLFVFAISFGNVWMEFLQKRDQTPTVVKNLYVFTSSLLTHLVILFLFKPDIGLEPDKFFIGHGISVWWLIVLSTITALCWAKFLKEYNSIAFQYCAGLSLIVVTTFSGLLSSEIQFVQTIIPILLFVLSLVLFDVKDVVNLFSRQMYQTLQKEEE